MQRPHPLRTPVIRVMGAIVLLAFTAGCRFETVEEEDIEASVEATLDRAAAAWGGGRIGEVRTG